MEAGPEGPGEEVRLNESEVLAGHEAHEGVACSHCEAAGPVVDFLTQPIVMGVVLAVVAVLVVLLLKRAARGGKRRGGRGRRSENRGGGGGAFVEIYVGNLSYDMTEDQLRREFEKYGTVKSARVIENRYNKKSKGFGFVEMPVRSEAEAAIQALHDKDVMGRKMRVNEAKNKTRD